MDPWLAAASAAGGYLVGSLSMARLVSRLAAPGTPVKVGTEIRLDGSDKSLMFGTVSASSVSLQHGAKYGFLTYVLDMLKVIVPISLVRALIPGTFYFLLVAVAATVGHIWPVWHRFRGGRGLAPIYATVLVIDWLGMFVTSIVGMAVGLFVARSIPLAYMVGVWLLVPWFWFRTHRWEYVVFALAANALFAVAVAPELRQWAKIRHEEKWNDPTELMKLSGMGRGILKMARRLGIVKGA